MSKYFYGACALISLALLSAAGCKRNGGGGGASVSGNLGTVDGEPITDQEFYGYLQRKPVLFAAVQGRQVQVQVADTVGIQAMRDLVQQKLLLEIAKEEGILPTSEQVNTELESRRKQDPNYVNNLQQAGLSLDDIKHDITLSLASEAIETKGVTITAAQAKDYINQHKAQFSSPPQAKLLFVVVKSDADKAKVDTDLKGGQSFAAVAVHYSTAPNARQNGAVFPVTNITQMPAPLQKMVSQTPEDKATAWVKDGANNVKFFVSKKEGPKPVAVTDDLVKNVQRALAKQKSPNGPDFQKRLLQKIQSSKVVISVPFYQQAWNSYATTSASAAAAHAIPGVSTGKKP